MKSIVGISILIMFSLPSFSQDIKGTYAIQNLESGIYIRIKDANTKNGTPIVTYSPVNWKCVTWDFKKEKGNVYKLENLFSHKTMQPASEAKEGVSLEEQPLQTESRSQLYEFIRVADNTYLIKLSGSELYVTPSVKTDESNAPILLMSKNGSKLQQWKLTEQHPTM